MPTLINERRKREIDPTLTKLRELSMAEPDPADRAVHAPIAELRQLIEQMTRFHDNLARFETERLIALMSTGAWSTGRAS